MEPATFWKYCPHCGASLAAPAPPAPIGPAPEPKSPPAEPIIVYDQTKHWDALVKRQRSIINAPTNNELIEQLRRQARPSVGPPFQSIVHVVMDREITPTGDALRLAVDSDGRLGPASDLTRLQERGYVIEDGRVKQVDDVPVGRAFCALQYWGGQRQHKRWHLAAPIVVNPSRSGDPYFMDGYYFAFGAAWTDLDRLEEAIRELVDLLRLGPPDLAGNPLLIDIFWLNTLPGLA